MNQIITLTKKEFLEAWREKKLLWLPIVLCIIAISQPISMYYMPEILNSAGNLPEGTVIEIPIPSGVEVLQGVLSQIGVIGTAIFILSTMGIISQERNSGILALLMTRPIKASHYIGSKWIAHAVLLIGSFSISYMLAYYYTNLLFSKVEPFVFFGSLGVYSLWILFVLSITIGIGTFVEKNGGIAGLSILLVALVSVGNSLFPSIFKYTPANLSNEVNKFLLTGHWDDQIALIITITLGIIILFLFLAIYLFSKKESKV